MPLPATPKWPRRPARSRQRSDSRSATLLETSAPPRASSTAPEPQGGDEYRRPSALRASGAARCMRYCSPRTRPGGDCRLNVATPSCSRRPRARVSPTWPTPRPTRTGAAAQVHRATDLVLEVRDKDRCPSSSMRGSVRLCTIERRRRLRHPAGSDVSEAVTGKSPVTPAHELNRRCGRLRGSRCDPRRCSDQVSPPRRPRRIVFRSSGPLQTAASPATRERLRWRRARASRDELRASASV
jgi:hypothetical protein